MELDELKKSWNELNKHLKTKELIKDEDITRLIKHAGTGINTIVRLNIKLIVLSLPILFLFIATIFTHREYDLIYIIILITFVPAICWDIFMISFLKKTKVDEMPLIETIDRINRFQRWMIRERLVGCLFILGIAIFSFIKWRVWQVGVGMILFFVLLWGGILILILWMYRYKFLNRIQDIKKNLDELKDLTD